jgi:hypothetical protein
MIRHREMNAAIPASLVNERRLAPVNGVDAPGNRFALETLRDGFLLESVVIRATEKPP